MHFTDDHVFSIPGIGLYVRVFDMSQKGLYKRVQYDPVAHRTFYKPKKGGVHVSNNTAAAVNRSKVFYSTAFFSKLLYFSQGDYEYHDSMLQNRKIDNLWSMDEARRMMEEKESKPVPKKEIVPVIVPEVTQQTTFEGPTFAFKR